MGQSIEYSNDQVTFKIKLPALKLAEIEDVHKYQKHLRLSLVSFDCVIKSVAKRRSVKEFWKVDVIRNGLRHTGRTRTAYPTKFRLITAYRLPSIVAAATNFYFVEWYDNFIKHHVVYRYIYYLNT